jgi:hypothetical protein
MARLSANDLVWNGVSSQNLEVVANYNDLDRRYEDAVLKIIYCVRKFSEISNFQG